jgi:hypothetical protein
LFEESEAGVERECLKCLHDEFCHEGILLSLSFRVIFETGSLMNESKKTSVYGSGEKEIGISSGTSSTAELQQSAPAITTMNNNQARLKSCEKKHSLHFLKLSFHGGQAAEHLPKRKVKKSERSVRNGLFLWKSFAWPGKVSYDENRL